MPTIEKVTAKYISLRQRKAELAEKQAQEMQPINQAMDAIEVFLMAKMNELGVDSFKTPAGTPYKATQTSVKLSDAGAFKGHVFAPALEHIRNYLCASGYEIQDADLCTMETLLRENARWDIVDFRAGKKGIVENLEQTGQLPPGIEINTIQTVNVRKG